jgi:Leucine-rich repeat (LRR) protein
MVYTRFKIAVRQCWVGAVLFLISCGEKSTEPPVIVTLDPYTKDTMAIRKILDTNNLRGVAIDSKICLKDTKNPDRVGEVRLQGKNLSIIPKEIGELTFVKLLILDSNSIRALPPEIGNCKSLTRIQIVANRLTGLPPEIGLLDSLNTFLLSHNELATLPAELGNLKALQSLTLDFNRLATIPASFGALTKLQRLLLNDNQITELPTSVTGITIQFLTMNNNKLCTVSDVAVKAWLDKLADADWATNQNCP